MVVEWRRLHGSVLTIGVVLWYNLHVENSENLRYRDERGRFTVGNPGGTSGGRPLGVPSLVEALRKRLRARPEELDAIVDALIAAALSSNRQALRAIREAFDRIDGRPTESIKLTGVAPVRIEFVPAEALLRKQAADKVQSDDDDDGFDGLEK